MTALVSLQAHEGPQPTPVTQQKAHTGTALRMRIKPSIVLDSLRTRLIINASSELISQISALSLSTPRFGLHKINLPKLSCV